MSLFVIKRSLKIAGRPSSISLEKAFWESLKAIAADRGVTTDALINTINAARYHPNLASAIRLFVIDHYRTRTGAISAPRNSDVETIQSDQQFQARHVPLASVSSQYCQERAAQARNLAKQMSDPKGREAILAIAQQYEDLANRAVLLGTRAAKVSTDPSRVLEEKHNKRPDLRLVPSTPLQPSAVTPAQ
jgi:predicted DNA-binding ribbon-helix-helix protein